MPGGSANEPLYARSPAVPLAIYFVLLLLSCGLRAWAGTEAVPAAALLDHAARWVCGRDVMAWWSVRGVVGVAVGLGAGQVASRVLSRASRTRPMRELNAELAGGLWSTRPWVLALTAVVGGAAEEVFFRGVLQPWLGVWLSALAFGAVHVRLRERFWLWPLISAVFGLVASCTYVVTGTLLAPIVMHVLVNLRAQPALGRLVAAREKQRTLGGLLRT